MNRRKLSLALFAGSTAVAAVLGTVATASARETTASVPPSYVRASVATGGGQVQARVEDVSVSDDGRFTVFSSQSEDLVPGDTNEQWDIFRHDNDRNVTTRLSVSSTGEQSSPGSGGGLFSSYSAEPSMSADGRYVVFESLARNLVPDDTNVWRDIFMRDTVAGTTTRVSLTADGGQIDGENGTPAISSDGRFVAFSSEAALVPADTNGRVDLYLREIATGRTEWISQAFDGSPVRDFFYFPFTNVIVAPGGRHVAFISPVANLVPGDTNRTKDVFVRDVVTGTTVRASLSASSSQLDAESESASLSADGRLVAFNLTATASTTTASTNRAYLRDLGAGTTTFIGEADERTYATSISGDGRYVAFSAPYRIGERDTNQVFVRDLVAKTSRAVIESPTGDAVDGSSGSGTLSPNGRHLAFKSGASNLVDGDTNEAWDVFVRRDIN